MTAAVATAGVPGAKAKSVNKYMVALAVAIGALLEIIDTSIVNVALTDIQASVGATLTQASWVVSSYAVANVIVLPMTAWLGDRFGKKRYFVFSLIGFTGASVLCGMATSLPMLVAARILQGLMGGGLLAKAQAFLLETFPRHEQPGAQAFFGAIVIAGPAIGPTLGGYIVTNYDWRWIFYVNVPVGIAAVFLCLAALPEDTKAKVKSRIDWTAIGLLALGLGALQAALEEGASEDWFESRMITVLVVGSIAALVAFVHRELTTDVPIVDLRILRYRSLWAGSLLSVVVGMALYGALFAIPIFAQSIMQYSPQQTGMMLLPGALMSAFAMPVVGRIARRSDPRRVLVVGGLTLVTGLYMLTSLSPQSGEDQLFYPLLIRALGTVMMFLPLNLATLGPIPRHEISKATGFFSLTRQLGGSIGVALLSTLLGERQAFHRAVLVEKVGVSDVATLERLNGLTGSLVGRGIEPGEASQKALALLDGMVNKQAAVLSFVDTFWAVGALVLVCLPLVLLLGKPNQSAQVDAGH